MITVDNPYVTILSNENDNTFFGIGANSMYQGSFSVISSNDTPLSTEVTFNISWGSSSTSPCQGPLALAYRECQTPVISLY